MRRFFGFGFGELAGFSAPPAPALDVFKAVSAGQSNGDVRASSAAARFQSVGSF